MLIYYHEFRYVYKLKRTKPPFNLANVSDIARLYKPEFIDAFTSLMGVNITVTTHFENIGELIDWLNEVELRFNNRSFFNRKPKVSLTKKSLDDFLTDQSGKVYSLTTVMVFVRNKIKKLQPLLESNSDTSNEYYCRHLASALEDCYQLFYSVGIILKNS